MTRNRRQGVLWATSRQAAPTQVVRNLQPGLSFAKAPYHLSRFGAGPMRRSGQIAAREGNTSLRWSGQAASASSSSSSSSSSS
eukprot:CAMPEP_0202081412 /NCGR_PEP_ID=MMETSP0964-20121228/13994_1 /ASSEMBLY_ACC=CAM_ASM_000500 /TAXON_ID=4773 /ORGANISM="Schizochytrium aggregatum, Strain ATCC28209" /LENGTH=82 /DNA_ID=CAMNT_0048648967 /DNA_START=109 /DNA_END=354 /DNA_ORIENTATION=-